MPTFRNPFTRKDATRGSTPVDGRLAMAGLVTQSGDLGVTAGVLSGLTVTGRSTAPTWAYSVSAGHAVTTRGASDGANLTGLDGATDTPTVSAAPATGSRWDLIWIRQRDVDNADADSDAVLGVTSGTASGSPSKPYGAVPVGALVIAEAQVAAGASTTADPLVTITAVAPRVAARGGIIPVTSTAQRALLLSAGSPTSPVYVELSGVIYKGNGTDWTTISGPTLPYVRMIKTGVQARSAGSWTQIALEATADASGAQPWTITSAGLITFNEAGLYTFDLVVSATIATFAVQIRQVGANFYLAQSPTGSGASLSNSTSVTRRMAAGDSVIALIYPSVNTNVQIDAAGTPCFMAITKLSN